VARSAEAFVHLGIRAYSKKRTSQYRNTKNALFTIILKRASVLSQNFAAKVRNVGRSPRTPTPSSASVSLLLAQPDQGVRCGRGRPPHEMNSSMNLQLGTLALTEQSQLLCCPNAESESLHGTGFPMSVWRVIQGN
jgi:hypothetical protein